MRSVCFRYRPNLIGFPACISTILGTSMEPPSWRTHQPHVSPARFLQVDDIAPPRITRVAAINLPRSDHGAESPESTALFIYPYHLCLSKLRRNGERGGRSYRRWNTRGTSSATQSRRRTHTATPYAPMSTATLSPSAKATASAPARRSTTRAPESRESSTAPAAPAPAQ